MKEKIKKYCLKSIMFYTFIFTMTYITIKIILNINNYAFLKWVDTTFLLIIAIGLILGTIQIIIYFFKRKETSFIVIFSIILFIELVSSIVAGWGYIMFSNTEEIVRIDDRKMVKESHYELFSNDIEYYDYQNIFVRSKNIRIFENYNDAVGAGYYKGTIYYSDSGEILKEYDNYNKLIYDKELEDKKKEEEEKKQLAQNSVKSNIDKKQSSENNNTSDGVQDETNIEYLYEKVIDDNTIIKIEYSGAVLGQNRAIRIMKTTDGGITWKNQFEDANKVTPEEREYLGENDSDSFMIVSNESKFLFISEDIGFIYDKRYLMQDGPNRGLSVTTDGGKNFVDTKLNLDENMNIQNVYIDDLPYIEDGKLKLKVHTNQKYYEFESNDNCITWNFNKEI